MTNGNFGFELGSSNSIDLSPGKETASDSFRTELFDHVRKSWSDVAQLNATPGELVECGAEALVAAALVIGATALSRGHGSEILEQMAKAKVDRGVRNDIASLTKQIDRSNELDVPGLLRTRAESYLDLKDSRSALNDLDLAVKTNGGDPSTFEMRSRLHSSMGNESEADADYRNFAGALAKRLVARMYPDASSRDAASLIDSLKLVPPPGADKQFHRVGGVQSWILEATYDIEHGSPAKVARALTRRGALYQELGQNEPAMRDFDRAIENDGQLSEAFVQRSRLHKMIGNYSAAGEDVAQVRLLDLRSSEVSTKPPFSFGAAWARDDAERAEREVAAGKFGARLSSIDDEASRMRSQVMGLQTPSGMAGQGW